MTGLDSYAKDASEIPMANKCLFLISSDNNANPKMKSNMWTQYCLRTEALEWLLLESMKSFSLKNSWEKNWTAILKIGLGPL